ncbi:MAG: hypothetical protein WA869_18585, partial [Alloacidobacterium sp.]
MPTLTRSLEVLVQPVLPLYLSLLPKRWAARFLANPFIFILNSCPGWTKMRFLKPVNMKPS